MACGNWLPIPTSISCSSISEEAGEAAPALFREVLHHLWDLGFQVGHSMRTIQDCIELAGQDLTIRTAMMTARFLAGSPNLFQKFHRLYAKEVIGRGAGRFIEQKVEERRREYVKFGQTVYLLEPNVKKSKGGLRDFHLLRWAGMARFQAATLQDLADRSLLSRQDFLSLSEARDFLWRVRAFLHVEAGRAQEILSFDEQVRIAALYGFEDRPHLLGVEQFMQQYYRHTMGLHETHAPISGPLSSRVCEAPIVSAIARQHGGRPFPGDRPEINRSL